MSSRPRNTLSGALLRRGWTDARLAERAALSRAHLNRVKNRRARPRLRDALLIGRALELPVATLFLRDEDGS
jgi:transcriptional regulator with XRE-family HTH domain